MNIVDLSIIALVVVLTALALRGFFKKEAEGECAGCSSSKSCDVHKTGHCAQVQDMMLNVGEKIKGLQR